jgi:hypothetical protein
MPRFAGPRRHGDPFGGAGHQKAVRPAAFSRQGWPSRGRNPPGTRWGTRSPVRDLPGRPFRASAARKCQCNRREFPCCQTPRWSERREPGRPHHFVGDRFAYTGQRHWSKSWSFTGALLAARDRPQAAEGHAGCVAEPAICRVECAVELYSPRRRGSRTARWPAEAAKGAGNQPERRLVQLPVDDEVPDRACYRLRARFGEVVTWELLLLSPSLWRAKVGCRRPPADAA